MNRNLLIVVGVVVAAAIGGYFLINKGDDASNKYSNNSNSAEQVADLAMKAFGGKGSVKCTYQDESSQGTVYIKNGMVKVESTGTDNAQYGNVIMKNDTVWTWETNSTEGYIMENISQYQNDPKVPEEYNVNADSVREQVTQNEANCNEENIPDNTFDPPASIKFQSFSSMMEDVESQLPDGYQLPEGIDLPEGYQLPSN